MSESLYHCSELVRLSEKRDAFSASTHDTKCFDSPCSMCVCIAHVCGAHAMQDCLCVSDTTAELCLGAVGEHRRLSFRRLEDRSTWPDLESGSKWLVSPPAFLTHTHICVLSTSVCGA